MRAIADRRRRLPSGRPSRACREHRDRPAASRPTGTPRRARTRPSTPPRRRALRRGRATASPDDDPGCGLGHCRFRGRKVRPRRRERAAHRFVDLGQVRRRRLVGELAFDADERHQPAAPAAGVAAEQPLGGPCCGACARSGCAHASGAPGPRCSSGRTDTTRPLRLRDLVLVRPRPTSTASSTGSGACIASTSAGLQYSGISAFNEARTASTSPSAAWRLDALQLREEVGIGRRAAGDPMDLLDPRRPGRFVHADQLLVELLARAQADELDRNLLVRHEARRAGSGRAPCRPASPARPSRARRCRRSRPATPRAARAAPLRGSA